MRGQREGSGEWSWERREWREGGGSRERNLIICIGGLKRE